MKTGEGACLCVPHADRWRGGFAPFRMDEPCLCAATRYVELSSVCAGLVTDPRGYDWSKARAHVEGKGDSLVKVELLLERRGDWRQALGRRCQMRTRRCSVVTSARAGPWDRQDSPVEGKGNLPVKVELLLERRGDWRQVVGEALSDEDPALLRGHERTGRPLGSAGFTERLETLLSRVLKSQKRDRKSNAKTKRQVQRAQPR